MAVKAKKGKTIDKWRKKRYFSLIAPKIFQERELGQTLAYEPGELNGRCISSNLLVLTGNIKKQDINVTFRVTKVQGDTCFTMLERYEVTPAAIKRKVRRMRDRIDESFECVTKDNLLVRIKPLVVTAVKASRPVRAVLRKAMLNHVLSTVRKTDYDSLAMDIINDKFQRDALNALRKICPIRSIDIRVMKYLGEHKGPAPEVAVEGTPAEEADAAEPEQEVAAKASEEDVLPKGKEDGPAEGEGSSEDLGEDAPEEEQD
jgi:small subunit ribosomal protein S3Ae